MANTRLIPMERYSGRPPISKQFRDMLAASWGNPIHRRKSLNMAKTYADIQKKIESLQKAAEAMRQKEVEGVIQRIKLAIATYDLTARDLGFGGRGRPPAVKRGPGRPRKAAAKPAAAAPYRDESGKTWSGRGRRPGWINAALAAGKTLEQLRS